MRRIIKIGDIKLDNPLFIKEEFNQKNVKGISFNTLNGGKIVYESIKRNNANYYTLISKDSGWLKEETINQLLLLCDDIEVKTTMEFKDGEVLNIRFAYELGEVIETEDVINEDGGWFKVTIKTCRI